MIDILKTIVRDLNELDKRLDEVNENYRDDRKQMIDIINFIDEILDEEYIKEHMKPLLDDFSPNEIITVLKKIGGFQSV